MKTGIIGTGNMGRILIEALLESKAVSPSSMAITNRTLNKAIQIIDMYEGLSIYPTAFEVARNSDLVIICVKPLDVFQVIQDIKPAVTKNSCVVSITSPINVDQLEHVLPCSVARIIPSITNRALSGVSLFTFGKKCTLTWKRSLLELFSFISSPVEIEEGVTRVASDIVSCGPAFFSYLTRRFIEGAVSETKINEETAIKLASEMLIGLGQLLNRDFFTLPALEEKVCVKGGITGEGIKVLEKELGPVFEHLFHATHEKFAEDVADLKKQYTLH